MFHCTQLGLPSPSIRGALVNPLSSSTLAPRGQSNSEN